MILITKPFIPPKEEYEAYLTGIWEREWLTNNGPLVNELEQKLTNYLAVKNFYLVGNGTIALQIALEALEVSGEVITTPFSYVATTSAIVWQKNIPVFVDIDKHTLNIDASKIEQAITPNTKAILATHVFGNPCDVEKIELIAKKHRLKVIYDGAHCFGTSFKGQSIYEWGDISTLSFHATKLYQTIEGGGIISSDDAIMNRVYHMRNFGHDGPAQFIGVGVNGKASEFNAAMGLVNLKYIDQILKRRKQQYTRYKIELANLDIGMQSLQDELGFNYAYFPAIFENEELTVHVKETLERNNIFPRRYFYPSLTELDYVEGNCPISKDITSRVLCLPLYHTLLPTEQDKVIECVKMGLK